MPRCYQLAMKFLSLLILLFFLENTYAQTKYETTVIEKNFQSSAKVVIDEEQIKKSKAANVATLLATEANITISNSAFQPNSLFLRGGDSGQVLILVDNLPVYDPSTIQRTFNLNSLSVKSIKKITVIKGSQSVWYGGQALSAVIKIETLPTAGDKAINIKVATGSSSDQDLNLNMQQQVLENHFVFFRSQYQFLDEQSPVDSSTFKYKKRKNNFEFGYLNYDESKFYIKANQYSDRNENVTGVSGLDFASADTLDFITTNDSNQLVTVYSDSTVSLKPFFSVGLVQTHRQFNHGISQYNSSLENQEYKGTVIPVRAELRILNTTDARIDVGTSYQKEAMLYEEFKVEKSNSSNEMKGVFGKVEYDLNDELILNAGIRNDSDLHYSAVNTYQVGLNFKSSKLEYATGYRLPSLYHLYSNKGNSNLSPEFARTYSYSNDFTVTEALKASITLFETHIENLIAAKGNPLQYYNIGRTQTKGVESSLAYRMDSGEVVKASFAYQEPRDINSGRWLSKRPLQSGSLSLLKSYQDSDLTMELVGRGDRLDFKNSSQTVMLPGYAVLNAAYIYNYQTKYDIFFRGNNLLNKKYEESYGYVNRGTDFQVGVDAQF